jgi:hypothetical protein
MTTSVGMKDRKKQSSLSLQQAIGDPAVERALIALEGICMRILEDGASASRGDPDVLSWQHRFKNIATPVSLALAELKGPRHFHYHYRHSEKDDSVLKPVMENPLETLAVTCERALNYCQSKLVGIRDRELLDSQRQMESALRTFLMRYQDYTEKKSN